MQKLSRMSSALVRGSCLALGMTIAATLQTVPAQAQWKPTEPVEIMVHTRAGSSPDVLARTIQKIWQDENLVPVAVSVVNKDAQGMGFAYLNQFEGDGHRLTVSSTGTISGNMMGASAIGYRDLTPISLLMSEYIALGVHPESKYQTGEEFIEQLKKDPGSISIGTGGARGNPNHTAVALVAKAAGVDPNDLKMVVYSSGAEVRNATIGKHVDAATASAGSFIGQVESGLLKVIGVASENRMSGVLKDVPTWKEQGLDVVDSNWRWLGGPGGLSDEQIAYWEEVAARTVETDAWKEFVVKNRAETTYLDREDTMAFFERQEKVLGDLLSDLGLIKK